MREAGAADARTKGWSRGVRGRRLGMGEGSEWIRGEVGKKRKGKEKEMRGEGKERKGKIEKEKEK